MNMFHEYLSRHDPSRETKTACPFVAVHMKENQKSILVTGPCELQAMINSAIISEVDDMSFVNNTERDATFWDFCDSSHYKYVRSKRIFESEDFDNCLPLLQNTYCS